VEKELGRCFCTEECIQDYFQPIVEAMTEELSQLRASWDYGEQTRAQYAQYRQLTLDNPDEVWMEQTETGERRYSFISHFRNGEERFSYAAICLTIDGIPSFVYLGFATRDDNLVDTYRRGQDLKVEAEAVPLEEPEVPSEREVEKVLGRTGGSTSSPPAADPGVTHIHPQRHLHELQRMYAEYRRSSDIPPEDLEAFDQYVEPTLDDPDEIWSFEDHSRKMQWHVFIGRHVAEFDGETEHFVMIVIARAKSTRDELEILFSFPTVDPELVHRFRRGVSSLNKAFGMGWTRGRAA